MSDLKMTCPSCGSRTSDVGSAAMDDDPCPYCGRRLPEFITNDWEATRWWRVIRDGEIWAETSDEKDARSRMEPGDVLMRLYERSETKWRRES